MFFAAAGKFAFAGGGFRRRVGFLCFFRLFRFDFVPRPATMVRKSEIAAGRTWGMMRCLFMAASAVLVSACAFPGQVQRIAIDYNEAVANTSNELTFLNIVRARERH